MCKTTQNKYFYILILIQYMVNLIGSLAIQMQTLWSGISIKI